MLDAHVKLRGQFLQEQRLHTVNKGNGAIQKEGSKWQEKSPPLSSRLHGKTVLKMMVGVPVVEFVIGRRFCGCITEPN